MKPYRVIGIESSPYAVKVRSVFRYRRIPHLWIARMPQFFDETEHVRPLIMPVVQYPDGVYRTDSTSIIRDLEGRHMNGRSVIPEDRGQALLVDLIEDMADEWFTKCVFHYRFNAPTDRVAGAAWVMDDAYPDVDANMLGDLVDKFVARQVERMPLVGCIPTNAPLIEDSYLRLIEILEGFVATDRFLFGTRPSTADFAICGQLSTLAGDPTGGAIQRAIAPRTRHWVMRLTDCSGVEGEWSTKVSPLVCALLDLAGRIYLPFLVANATAIENGETEISVALDGRLYRQPVFGYQVKCLNALRKSFDALSTGDREGLDPLLDQAGCLTYLVG